VNELERKNTSLERQLSVTIPHIDDKIKEIQAVKHEKDNENLNEIEQRLVRRSNIIIFGVDEQTAGSVEERKSRDSAIVEELLHKLDVRITITNGIQRLGMQRPNWSRPIKVCGLDESTRSVVLRKSKSLRLHDKYKGIYINADLTPMQQKESKALREELNRRRSAGETDLVIYRGKIVQRPHPFQ
jgi:hypothetical protein